MLCVGVAEQGSDLLNWHNGACEKALRYADSAVDEILHGGCAKLFLEHANDMHFGDTEFVRDVVK